MEDIWLIFQKKMILFNEKTNIKKFIQLVPRTKSHWYDSIGIFFNKTIHQLFDLTNMLLLLPIDFDELVRSSIS